MKIAILIFDKLTALDAIGPYEVLSRVPEAELSFVAKKPGMKRTDTGALGINADLSLDELTDPDIVLVPGGEGNRPLLEDDEVLDWLRERARDLDLDDLGLHRLAGARRRRDPRGQARDQPLGLPRRAARVRRRAGSRASRDRRQGRHRGRRLGRDRHGAGAGRRGRRDEDVAKAIQLGIEYDPAPPFDSGSPEKADPELVELIRQYEGVDVAERRRILPSAAR